jgi:hypothetical protein
LFTPPTVLQQGQRECETVQDNGSLNPRTLKVDSVGNELAGATVEMKRHDLETHTLRVGGRAHNAKEGHGIHIELVEGDFVSGIPLS